MNNRAREGVSDKHWEKIKPLLPPQKPRRGRPNKDHRLMINGRLWILRTGPRWPDLAERFGPWATVYSRLRRWRQPGLWQEILKPLHEQAEVEGQIDWQVHHVDSSVIRAHQHAAGARRVDAQVAPEPPNRWRWAAARGASAARSICASRVEADP